MAERYPNIFATVPPKPPSPHHAQRLRYRSTHLDVCVVQTITLSDLKGCKALAQPTRRWETGHARDHTETHVPQVGVDARLYVVHSHALRITFVSVQCV